MSKTLALLILSLALNGVLLAVVSFPERSAPGAGRRSIEAAPPTDLGGPADPHDATLPFANSDVKKPARASTRSPEWLDSVNELVGELRRRGIDERLIRELAAAEAERSFRRRARALLHPRGASDYWEPLQLPFGSGAMSPAALKEYQRLRREAQAALRDLLGEHEAAIAPSDPNEVFILASERPSFDYLPADKQLELIEYLEHTAIDLYSEYGRIGYRGDPGKIELQREESVKHILGPALFDEYLKRSSPSAQGLRQELALFEPTQAEFDALVRIEWEARNERLAAGDHQQSAAKHQAIESRRAEAIRGVLGHARYEDYERSTDYAYQHLDRLARGRQLDAGVARAAYSHVQQARQRVARMSAGRDLNDAQVRAEISAISHALRQRLAADMGLNDLTEEQIEQALGPVAHVWPGEQRAGIRRWRRF